MWCQDHKLGYAFVSALLQFIKLKRSMIFDRWWNFVYLKYLTIEMQHGLALFMLYMVKTCRFSEPCRSFRDDADALLPNRDQVSRNAFQHCLRFCSLTSFYVCGKQGVHWLPLSPRQNMFYEASQKNRFLPLCFHTGCTQNKENNMGGKWWRPQQCVSLLHTFCLTFISSP